MKQWRKILEAIFTIADQREDPGWMWCLAFTAECIAFFWFTASTYIIVMNNGKLLRLLFAGSVAVISGLLAVIDGISTYHIIDKNLDEGKQWFE